ncbi:MAG: hypothetical protein FRX49_04221 [Trebouxia sp. A1-2]|nr:MAG: hypothetical protein FRX49_04221 [Trebouxia sp. A1-2]
MPGLPVSHLTPDQFKRWKEQKDLEKEQVGAAAQILYTSFIICSHSATAMVMVQEKTLAEQQRQDDINNGKASLTGRELYEKHPELFEDY